MSVINYVLLGVMAAVSLVTLYYVSKILRATQGLQESDFQADMPLPESTIPIPDEDEEEEEEKPLPPE